MLITAKMKNEKCKDRPTDRQPLIEAPRQLDKKVICKEPLLKKIDGGKLVDDLKPNFESQNSNFSSGGKSLVNSGQKRPDGGLNPRLVEPTKFMGFNVKSQDIRPYNSATMSKTSFYEIEQHVVRLPNPMPTQEKRRDCRAKFLRSRPSSDKKKISDSVRTIKDFWESRDMHEHSKGKRKFIDEEDQFDQKKQRLENRL